MKEWWLNPPEWVKALEERMDRGKDFSGVAEGVRGLVRRSAVMALAAGDARLKKRTLTNLYNERPGWLRGAHEKLDRAVISAYAEVDGGAGGGA